MKQIPLTQGKLALVDDEDFERVNQFKWYLSNYGYAHRNNNERKPRGTVRMHRFILDVQQGQDVDHISGDKLDNRKCNLRLATRQENTWNRGRNYNNKSGYKGVCWHRKTKKWLAAIMADGLTIHLGLFDNKEDASLAYLAAATLCHGEFARITWH